MGNKKVMILIVILFLLRFSLRAQKTEIKVKEITLSGYAADREVEFSGMAWFKNNLILLPQYPEKKSEIYTLPKQEILDYLSQEKKGQKPVALTPTAISFKSQYWDILDGYEGFEAIVTNSKTGDVWLTIEFEPEQGNPYSLMVRGKLNDDMTSLTIDPIDYISYKVQKIPSQTNLSNMAEEALIYVPTKGHIISIHEANGVEGKKPINAIVFSEGLNKIKEAKMPIIPFRITDATELDLNGRFWVLNYFYEGDRCLSVLEDNLIKEYKIKQGSTHRKNPFVERLVELQYKDGQITLSNNKPIQLALNEVAGRNWEGIAKLDDSGFLLITDKYPRTILGFVKR